jgi:hypothetical protein
MPINFTNVVDLNNNRIQNVGAPALSSDAVTKQYVDNIATGLVWKNAVRVAATSNVSVSSPGATIDSVTLANGNRILLMGQTNGAENGIYVFNGATSALTRATDADQDSEVEPGAAVTVSEGTTNGNKTFVLITPGPITVGTTSLNWALLNAGTSPVYTGSGSVDITNHVVTAIAASNGGISVASGVGVVADPVGGVAVGTNGVAAKIASNSGLAVDASGLKFVPTTAGGLMTDANGASVVIKANSGLAVDATGVQTVLATNKGLSVDATGLQVTPGNGVAVDATGVVAVADPAGGLQVGAAGVAAKLPASSGLAASSSGLVVVANPSGGLTVDTNGVAAVAKPNSGISVDNTGIGAVLAANKGLSVDSNGLAVNTDPAGGLVSTATGLAIKPSSNMGITVDSNGISATLDANGGIGVTSAGLEVVAGQGIVVDSTGVHVDLTVMPRKFSATIGDGTATSIAVTHSLNTRDVQVQIFATAAPYDTVYAEVSRTDANTVTVDFGQAPTSGQYRVVVVG